MMTTVENLHGIDFNTLRPYFRNGRACTSGGVSRDVVSEGILRLRDVPLDSDEGVFFELSDWRLMDSAVVCAARPRLDVSIVFHDHKNGLFLRHKPTESAYRDGDDVYPLPFITSQCSFTQRQLLASRDLNVPIDISTIAQASQMVAERVERVVLGVHEPLVFDDIPLYGMCNHPNRITQVITNPWCSDGSRNPKWSKDVIYDEIGKTEATMRKRGFTGDLHAFVSCDLKELNVESLLAAIDVTITSLLPYGTVVLCEMTPETMQIYFAHDFTLIQHPKAEAVMGGDVESMRINLKVAGCEIPIIHKNHCGIAHLTVGAP